jgi:hypothetical protein
MKVFWAILLGAFAIAAAIVFFSGEQPEQIAQVQTPPAAPGMAAPNPATSRPIAPTSPDIDTPTESPSEPGDDLPRPAAVTEIDEPVETLNIDDLLGIEPEPNRITPEIAIEEAGAPMQGPRTISQQAMAEFAELALQAAGSAEEASRVAGSISPDDQPEAEADGLKIGRVTIPGTGTEADPYELPWGVLISAIRTYNPRLELNELPAWADALNDRHVRITGFAFLPVVASETDEILLMLNPWDGCHMGAPPTPYDSVEVMLDGPVNMGGRNGFVTVTGRFNVDPYLIRGWLVSLYTMDDANLEFAGS